jgi:RNA polymerase sigma factor for flagellar operon FliA
MEWWYGFSPDEQNKIIVEHLPDARDIASRMVGRYGKDYDDAVQNGVVGLIDAAKKYDPNKGTKFKTYATIRIRGEILNGLETSHNIITKPVSRVREKVKISKKNIDDIQRKLRQNNKDATTVDVADEIINESFSDVPENKRGSLKNKLIKDIEEVLLALKDECLRKILSTIEKSPEEVLIEEEIKKENRKDLKECIKNLGKQYQEVIIMFHWKKLKQKEIAEILQCSENAVTIRIHRATEMLYKCLEEKGYIQ